MPPGLGVLVPAAWSRTGLAPGVAPAVPGHQRVALGQDLHDRCPSRAVGSRPVGQHQDLTGSRGLVVQLDAVQISRWHVRLLAFG